MGPWRGGPLLLAAFLFLGFQGAASGMDSGKERVDAAADILIKAEDLLKTDRNDPNLHFIRGMALAELGRYLEATDEFRWMLTHDPALPRPRLELARMQMYLRQYGSAKYNFEQVLAADIPEAVRRNILNILANIRERTPTLSLAFEFVSDTNPNQATSGEEVEIRGLRYRLNDGARAAKSTGARFAFDGRIPLGESNLWFARTAGEIQEFEDRRFNFQYLQAAGGRHFHFPDRTLTIEAGGHGSTYGNRLLYDGVIVGASDYRQVRQDIGVRIGVAGQQFNYRDYSYLSGWQYSASLQGFYAPVSTRRFELSAGVVKNAAEERPYSYLQANVGGRYVQEWVGGWITGLSASLADSKYEAADPIFLERRHDSDRRFELEVSNRRIRLWKFTPRLDVGWMERHSSIDLFSYTRSYIRIGLTGDF